MTAAAKDNRTASGSPSITVVFTIVSSNYAAQAKVLMDSIERTNPGVLRVIVAADNMVQPEFPGHVVVFAEDTRAPWRDMSAYYDALEYNTAIKPFCFAFLFEQAHVQKVIYLDPDILVFRPLESVLSALDRSDIVLTPHMTTPLGVDGRTPDDHAILRSGVYNLGFLGLRRSRDADAFVTWWAERCRFDCRVAFEEGLFTDQRWVDLAPGFFESVTILRHPGLNLGYWNLAPRHLQRQGDDWIVDAQPLFFFHYSGFDPHAPLALSKHQTRIEVERDSPLADLLALYGKALTRSGHRSSHMRPYRFANLDSGRPLTSLMRRTILASARLGLVDSTHDLSAWLDAPDPMSIAERGVGMTRVVARLWIETPDAADRFPLTTPAGREAWAAYVARIGTDRGLDTTSLVAFAALWTGAAAATDATGDPAALEAWPPACADLWRKDPELRAILPRPQAADRLEALAYCLGPAALQGRFDPSALLAEEDLGPDGGLVVARRAVQLSMRFLDPRFRRDDALASSLCAAFGISHRAAWPEPLVRRLRAAAELDGVADGPFGVPEVLRRIVLSRPDLQRIFPTRGMLPLRLANWFVRLGLAEYGCEFDALPAATKNNLAIHLASLRRA